MSSAYYLNWNWSRKYPSLLFRAKSAILPSLEKVMINCYFHLIIISAVCVLASSKHEFTFHIIAKIGMENKFFVQNLWANLFCIADWRLLLPIFPSQAFFSSFGTEMVMGREETINKKVATFTLSKAFQTDKGLKFKTIYKPIGIFSEGTREGENKAQSFTFVVPHYYTLQWNLFWTKINKSIICNNKSLLN